jgi:hypothetical protein
LWRNAIDSENPREMVQSTDRRANTRRRVIKNIIYTCINETRLSREEAGKRDCLGRIPRIASQRLTQHSLEICDIRTAISRNRVFFCEDFFPLALQVIHKREIMGYGNSSNSMPSGSTVCGHLLFIRVISVIRGQNFGCGRAAVGNPWLRGPYLVV